MCVLLYLNITYGAWISHVSCMAYI